MKTVKPPLQANDTPVACRGINTSNTIGSILNRATAYDSDNEALFDLILTEHVSQSMKNRLSVAAMCGKHGWQTAPVKDLTIDLHKAIEEQDWISVANYAAMIYARQSMATDIALRGL